MADKMLIDGLIKFCDEKSKNIKLKAEPQVFIEIKQALEEFKALKEKNETLKALYQDTRKEGSNLIAKERAKAIDEFLHNAETKICDRILQNQARLDFASGLSVANRILDEIAEQMKGEEYELGKDRRLFISQI